MVEMFLAGVSVRRGEDVTEVLRGSRFIAFIIGRLSSLAIKFNSTDNAPRSGTLKALGFTVRKSYVIYEP